MRSEMTGLMKLKMNFVFGFPENNIYDIYTLITHLGYLQPKYVLFHIQLVDLAYQNIAISLLGRSKPWRYFGWDEMYGQSLIVFLVVTTLFEIWHGSTKNKLMYSALFLKIRNTFVRTPYEYFNTLKFGVIVAYAAISTLYTECYCGNRM